MTFIDRDKSKTNTKLHYKISRQGRQIILKSAFNYLELLPLQQRKVAFFKYKEASLNFLINTNVFFPFYGKQKVSETKKPIDIYNVSIYLIDIKTSIHMYLISIYKWKKHVLLELQWVKHFWISQAYVLFWWGNLDTY